jgi:hypothetical protein
LVKTTRWPWLRRVASAETSSCRLMIFSCTDHLTLSSHEKSCLFRGERRLVDRAGIV